MIETTINAQTKYYLSSFELADFIKEMQFPPKFSAQIYNLFTDVPIQDLDEFAEKFAVSDAVLKEYYKLYIKQIYPNLELEEMLLYAE